MQAQPGGSYLTQEGLQVIPVQNRLVTRIVPCLEPRKGEVSPTCTPPAGDIPWQQGSPQRQQELGGLVPGQWESCRCFSRGWGGEN